MIYMLSVIPSMNFDDLSKITQLAKTVKSLNQMGATPFMGVPGPSCLPCGPPMSCDVHGRYSYKAVYRTLSRRPI